MCPLVIPKWKRSGHSRRLSTCKLHGERGWPFCPSRVRIESASHLFPCLKHENLGDFYSDWEEEGILEGYCFNNSNRQKMNLETLTQKRLIIHPNVKPFSWLVAERTSKKFATFTIPRSTFLVLFFCGVCVCECTCTCSCVHYECVCTVCVCCMHIGVKVRVPMYVKGRMLDVFIHVSLPYSFKRWSLTDESLWFGIDWPPTKYLRFTCLRVSVLGL